MSIRFALLGGALAFFASCGPAPKPECSGCTSNGSCVPVSVSVSSAQGCGIGGQVCAVCTASQSCNNGLCIAIGPSGGGGGTTGGGTGGGVTGGGGGTTGGGTGGGVTGGGGGTTGGGTGGGVTGGGGGVTGGGGGVTGGGGGVTGGGGGVTGGGGGVTGGGGGVTGGGGGATGGGGGVTGGGGGVTGGGAGTGGGVTGGGTGGGVTGGGTGGGGITCTSGLSMCSGRCVDVRIDANNCNLCGRACGGGQTCQAGVCTNSSVNGLVFSEINPGLSTIEVFNGGSATVNLLNYSLQYTLGDGGSGSIALPSYDVPAQGFVLFGQGPADAGYLPAAAVSLRTTDFALRLLSPTASGVDFVRSGGSAVPPPTGTTWTGANLQNPTLATSQSIVRNLFTPDSDSAADWSLTPNASPLRVCARPSLCGTSCIDVENDRANCGGCGNLCAASQVCRSGACVAGGGQLLISEYKLDPVPMVELYNPGPNPVPLSGYRVQVASLGTFLFTFPAGRILSPGKFVVLYAAAGADDAITAYAGAAPPASSFTDTSAITLFDGTTGVDFVRFGSSGSLPPAGISWFGAGPTYPPVSAADLSVHRKLDVIDSDDALNWVTYNPSTVGFTCQAGMTLCGGRCVNLSSNLLNCGACGSTCTSPQACVRGTCSSVSGIVISRLSNVAPERIELYNGTATSSSLDLHAVEWVTESGTDSFSIPIGTTVASGGYLSLIEGTGTNTAGTIYMNKSIVWSTEIAVSLKSPSNLGIDFVRTGPSTALPATGTTWTGVNAPNPSDTVTEVLERNVQLPDTNTAADWNIYGQVFGQSCGTNLSVCGSTCVNLTSSSSNCGTCGNICPAGCQVGQCTKGSGSTSRLVGGTLSSGILEVFNAGEWRLVCDDGLTNVALVACREMGFTGGTATGLQNGSPNTNFWLDDVVCTGTEASLFECAHLPLGQHNCSPTGEAIRLNCF